MSSQTTESDLEDIDQFYDHERVALNKVLSDLMENIGRHREMGSFQREARDRFAEIGFVVRVDLYESEHEDHLRKEERTQFPEISIIGRCDPVKIGEFDHDQMGHEVRSNIIGEKGRESSQRTQVAPGWDQTKSGIVVPGGK